LPLIRESSHTSVIAGVEDINGELLNYTIVPDLNAFIWYIYASIQSERLCRIVPDLNAFIWYIYASIQSELLCLIHKRTVMFQLCMRHSLCWDNKCEILMQAPSILQAIQPWITRKIRNNRSISTVIFIVKFNQMAYIIPNCLLCCMLPSCLSIDYVFVWSCNIVVS
jgi:hypothetical protein